MALLHKIADRHRRSADFTFYSELGALPHFDPNVEDDGLPISVQQLRAAIAAADAVIFCTPEYVFSVPAILKNAIEWCVAATVFTNKPTAMIVASGVGEKTFESLSLILKTIQCKISAETTLHLKGVRAKMLTGDLSDASVLEQLDTLFAALLAA
jgi:chromate reductase, NAD(P)H dehydrogenase (quinone)